MPQMNAAPSPSPVLIAPAPANAVSAKTSANDLAAPAAPAQSFDSVLRQHIDQQAKAPQSQGEKPEAPAATAATAAAAAETAGKTVAEPAAANDIALIAQMLPGIVPPGVADPAAQEAQGTAGAKGKKSAADVSEDPVVLAAPALPGVPGGVPNVPNATPATDAAATTKLPAAATRPGAAENLAANDLRTAASHAGSEPSGPEFASVLTASREQSAAAAGPAAAAHATASAAAAAAVPVEHVQTPVGQRGWGSEVGDKLTWMVSKQETRADLVLNPPELGRIEVSISMNGDHASASFVSANPLVRDAIESAVPRLREVLQDAGITLGQAQVGAESFQQSTASRENGDNSWRGASSGAATADAASGGVPGASAAPTLRAGNGLVDTFA